MERTRATTGTAWPGWRLAYSWGWYARFEHCLFPPWCSSISCTKPPHPCCGRFRAFGGVIGCASGSADLAQPRRGVPLPSRGQARRLIRRRSASTSTRQGDTCQPGRPLRSGSTLAAQPYRPAPGPTAKRQRRGAVAGSRCHLRYPHRSVRNSTGDRPFGMRTRGFVLRFPISAHPYRKTTLCGYGV